MYDGERLQSTKLTIDSPDSEKTLEDAKEIRLKMKDKMIELNYETLNALYETFVPQMEIPIEQTYLSTTSIYVRSHKGVKASANSDIIFFFTSAQEGNRLLDDERLCLADDLKKAHDHNQNKSK
ncbi:hypothetical protein Tco_0031064 [Tanacetum coccineum]